MVEFRIEATQIVIQLRGWSALWAFRSRVVIPLDAIQRVHVMDRVAARAIWKTIRAPGTFIPGVIIAGTYYGRRGRSFWYVRDVARAICIHCERGPFRAVVVEVSSPERVADQIREALRERGSGQRDRSWSASDFQNSESHTHGLESPP